MEMRSVGNTSLRSFLPALTLVGVGSATLALGLVISIDFIASQQGWLDTPILASTPAWMFILLILLGIGLIWIGSFQTKTEIRRTREASLAAQPSLSNNALSEKPSFLVFGSRMGLLIAISALRDLASQILVVLPPNEDPSIYEQLLNLEASGTGKFMVANTGDASVWAMMDNGVILEELVAIKESRKLGSVHQMHLKWPQGEVSEHPNLNPEIAEQIGKVDYVILGPASLFTELIPSLLPNDIQIALQNRKGITVYICNIMTQPGRTEGFRVSDHIDAIESHGNFDIDCIVVNNQRIPFELARKYHDSGAQQVLLSLAEYEDSIVRADTSSQYGTLRYLGRGILIETDLMSTLTQTGPLESANEVAGYPTLVVRHDPVKLQSVLNRIVSMTKLRSLRIDRGES